MTGGHSAAGAGGDAAAGAAGTGPEGGAPGDVPPSTIVTIENVSTQKYLDVQGSYTTDGTAVWSYSYTGSQNQQWMFRDFESGSYEIININSAKCLEVAGDLKDNGSTLEQYTCTGANNQLWALHEANGMLQIIGKSSGKCLMASGKADASLVVIWDCLSDPTEAWLLQGI